RTSRIVECQAQEPLKKDAFFSLRSSFALFMLLKQEGESCRDANEQHRKPVGFPKTNDKSPGIVRIAAAAGRRGSSPEASVSCCGICGICGICGTGGGTYAGLCGGHGANS
ncbi:MAG: hypothetical protein L6R39_006276, partial [Caloplaca ligustica]